jgi:NADPH:quinone reductase-like Zn-dependent oxidoreductase
MMKAITQDTYGSADVLELRDVERPEVGAGEVLVRVRAAGVDRGVWHLMTGLPYPVRLAGYGLRAPKNPVPGMDVAGVVEAVGDRVTRFRPGDEVFGIGKGTFAELALADESKLAPKPSNLTFEQAAAVAISGLTALQGLRDHARVRPGQHVLVIGASGGVGSYAVQLAKAFGAEVTGVASTAKADLVRSLGADHVLDYTVDDFTDGSHHYDLVLVIGGNSSIPKLRRTLTPTGTFVLVGGEEGGRWTGGFGRSLRAAALSPFVRQRLAMLVAKEHFSTLEGSPS